MKFGVDINMEELEDGYYWVSFDGGVFPTIAEKCSYGWETVGIEYILEPKDFIILGKVSNTIETI